MSSKKQIRSQKSQHFLKAKQAQLDTLLGTIESPEEVEVPTKFYPPPQAQSSIQPQDSLTLLLNKAKDKIEKSHSKQKLKSMKVEPKAKKVDLEAFMTEVLVEAKPKQQVEEEYNGDTFDQEILKLLQKKSLDDELSQLRREIKKTNGSLRSYSKEVLNTKKSVKNLAGRYGEQFKPQLQDVSGNVDFSGYALGLRSLKHIKTQRVD